MDYEARETDEQRLKRDQAEAWDDAQKAIREWNRAAAERDSLTKQANKRANPFTKEMAEKANVRIVESRDPSRRELAANGYVEMTAEDWGRYQQTPDAALENLGPLFGNAKRSNEEYTKDPALWRLKREYAIQTGQIKR